MPRAFSLPIWQRRFCAAMMWNSRSKEKHDRNIFVILPHSSFTNPAPRPNRGRARGRLDAGTIEGLAAEMRCRALRDRRGDTRAGWGGGHDGRYAPSEMAVQAVGNPAHRPCATSGGYQWSAHRGPNGASLKHRARDAGEPADLRLYRFRHASVSRGAEVRGSGRRLGAPRQHDGGGIWRSARPLFFRATNAQTKRRRTRRRPNNTGGAALAIRRSRLQPARLKAARCD
jgi:hypothetical protein